MWCPRPLRFLVPTLLAILALSAASDGEHASRSSAAEGELLANVRGIVWYDERGLGEREGSEPLAAGARVTLHPDAGAPASYTNGLGAFAFSAQPGRYTLEVWWDDPLIAPRRTGGHGGAYHVTPLDLHAGQTHDLQIGVRPTLRFPALVDAKIEVVWPHDERGHARPVLEAPLANVVAYLFHAGTAISVPCSYSPELTLVAAVDDEPGRRVATGVKRIAEDQGRRFPAWVFDDVDVSAAQSPSSRVYFWLEAKDGLGSDDRSYAEPRFRSNVWAHGDDPRTSSPDRVVPRSVSYGISLAARIDVLWPHDRLGRERTVDRADLANLDVLLLESGSAAASAPPEIGEDVWLLKSVDSGPAVPVRGRKVVLRNNGLAYPQWVFEDVDVREARDPARRLFFRAIVVGTRASTNVWAHGDDGRTHFPKRDVPIESAHGCR